MRPIRPVLNRADLSLRLAGHFHTVLNLLSVCYRQASKQVYP